MGLDQRKVKIRKQVRGYPWHSRTTPSRWKREGTVETETSGTRRCSPSTRFTVRVILGPDICSFPTSYWLGYFPVMGLAGFREERNSKHWTCLMVILQVLPLISLDMLSTKQHIQFFKYPQSYASSLFMYLR